MSYVSLAESGELARRAAEAYELLGPRCLVCPRLCKVDRRADVKGLCAIGRHAVVASHFPHFGEEDVLRGRRGSGTIFFSGCNLRCVFCLPPGSLVATDRGPRRIEEIFSDGIDEIPVGEGRVRRPSHVRVRAMSGEFAAVSKVFMHGYCGELIRLKAMSAPELVVTANHKLFVAERDAREHIVELPASEVTKHHYLVVPKPAHIGSPVTLDVAGILAEQPIRTARRKPRRWEADELVAALGSARTSADLGTELGYHPAYIRTLRSRLARGRLETTDAVPLSVQVEDGRVRFVGERRPGIPEEVVLDENVAWRSASIARKVTFGSPRSARTRTG